MIEDVDYLNDNCEKDSMIFFIDSSLRDRQFYPSSSDYSISFAQPFKLVYGIDILDASIPTTEYNIDVENNTLAITLVGKPILSNANLMTYFKQLRTSKSFSRLFDHSSETFVLIANEVMASTWNVTSTQTLFNDNVTRITEQYYVGIRKEILNVTFADTRGAALIEEDYIIEWDDMTFFIRGNTNSNIEIINVLKQGEYYLERVSAYVYNIVYYMFYSVSYDDVYSPMKENEDYIYEIYNYIKRVEPGNYDISSLRVSMNNSLNAYDIYMESKSSVERQEGKLNIMSQKLVVLNAEKSTITPNLGFDTYPTSTESSLYDTYYIGNNKNVFVSKTYDSDTRKYTLFSPGIINLLGERYVILRCKEIEDHLFGSYAYMSYTPGIGMFKLAASYNDITNLRFDFVSLVRKPFHPIGKLSKLSFKWETASGRVYDFKGVNHQLLMLVKFLVPTQKKKFQQSILNPNYNANFMEYMTKNKAIQYKEDSEDEEEFDNTHYYNVYKKMMDKYNYSSSDDEYDSDDSEEQRAITSIPRRA